MCTRTRLSPFCWAKQIRAFVGEYAMAAMSALGLLLLLTGGLSLLGTKPI